MMVEKGKISSSQLVTLIIIFVVGTSVVLSPARDAKQSGWLAVIVGMGIGIIYNAIYAALAMRFPGKLPMEYNDIIFGRYLGKLISISQLWFFFHLGSFTLRDISEFFTAAVMPETPMIAFAVLMMLVCASAVRNGIEVIARCSPLILVISFITVFNDFILQLKDIKFSNYLPLFCVDLRKFLVVSYDAASFPFAETVAFLMIFPFVNKDKEIFSSTVKGILLGGFFLLVEVIRNIGILGASAGIYTYPTYAAVRLIDVAKIITRLEVLVSSVFMLTVFIKCSILLYCAVTGSAYLLKMRSYLPLVLPVSSLMILFSIINFDNVVENIEFAAKIYPIYSLPFQLIIPLVSLVVAAIRHLPGDK